ncbi:hypothetical protein B0F87_107207 [Methylobacter tundripaludum]|uniref:Uncharacterized protein n=1 Tax=Methylobacter tundripaludum TaxID=173365 RepID=A0A2S6HBU8_9GAMM|nr:ABC-three component system middle component 5 [Methylobacter tundripaludum]PPK74964.1 hypothetical protein B0F87_107207 [Methylobacter tundripaludum]
MLIYHQRNDVYHCTFRLLSIFNMINTNDIEFARLKIIDFYIVFPHLISTISLPRAKGISKIKKEVQTLPVPYEKLPSSRMLFSEMGDIQLQAIDILKAKKILEVTEEGVISKGKYFSSEAVQSLVIENNITSKWFYKDFIKILIECPFYGENGLKKRTGLMEYRYDAV